MRLDEGWNQIQFNLSDFTRRAYGTNYIETLRYVSNSRALFKFIARLKFCNDYSFTPFCRVQIHANCRIRRIYFSDRLYTEDELPPEFKLFLPVAGKPQGQQMWAQSASAHQSRLGWIDKKGHYNALSIGWELKTDVLERAFVIATDAFYKTSLSSWRWPPDLRLVQTSKAHPNGLHLRDSPWQRSPKKYSFRPNQNT